MFLKGLGPSKSFNLNKQVIWVNFCLSRPEITTNNIYGEE